MKAQQLDPEEVDAVVLTHLHGNHFGGLPFLVLDGQFTRRTKPLTVLGCEAYTYDKPMRYHLDYGALRTQAHKLATNLLILTHLGPSMLSRLGDVEHTTATDRLILQP